MIKKILAVLIVAAALVVVASCVALMAAAQPAATKYTVKPGDSLSKIAAQFNTTVEALIEANRDKYPWLKIHP